MVTTEGSVQVQRRYCRNSSRPCTPQPQQEVPRRQTAAARCTYPPSLLNCEKKKMHLLGALKIPASSKDE
jgi:hypothetical protein